MLRLDRRPHEGLAASVKVSDEAIEATFRHPFWVVRGEDLAGRPRLIHLAAEPEGSTTPGRWVDAGDLRVGDELMLLDGRVVPVREISLHFFEGVVYNFEVHELHCYAVGIDGVLVHNGNGGPANAPNKSPLWTPTKGKTGVENAFGHWKKHGSEFPEIPNATQYAQRAKDFVTNPPSGTLTKVRPNGDKLSYDPATNMFAVQRADGALRTMFRPANGINYWNLQ